MKKEWQNLQKIISILIIAICMIIGIISILRMVNKNILVDRLQMENGFTKWLVSDNPGLLVEEEQVSVSWAKRYPFEEKKSEDANAPKEDKRPEKSFIQKANDKVLTFENRIAGIQEKIEYYYADALVGYPTFLEVGTGVEEKWSWGLPLSLRKPDYILLPNGHITGKTEQKDVTEAANNLTAFRDWLSEEKINFLYVQFPHKVPKYEDEYSKENEENFCNQNADDLLEKLANANVPYLDMRESMYQSGKNHYDCFYRTDHHWKDRMGLFAAGEIAKKLETENEENYLWEGDSYRTEITESCYMGSYGRNLTRAVIEPDDLEIFYPEFETNFHVVCEEMGVDKIGSWEKTLIDSKKLLKNYSYVISQYDAFCYGDRAVIEIENLNCSDGKRVLLLKDSFADVVSPYLALGVKELVVIDLRMFNGSVESYVKEYAPDTVIVAYNPAVIAETGEIHYNTHKDLWDFR